MVRTTAPLKTPHLRKPPAITSTQIVRLACLISCSLLSVTTAHSAENKHEVFRRWAVIATSELRDMGLMDLLTSHLTGQDGLELVEREQLALVTKELELSTYFASEAAPQRLKLGQTLRADALILLSRVEHKDKRFVSLVISDCLYGARLRLEYFPLGKDTFDELSRQCAAVVQDTRRQFAGGIKQLIGVSPFLSKNLTHDHDHLQSGYAALLASALSRSPGLAVIEIDEARAIGRELELSGSQLGRRVLPLFVEGEFEMEDQLLGEESKIRLDVRATDGKIVHSLVRRIGLSTGDVTEVLADAVPKRILQLLNQETVQRIGRQQQFRLLANRADSFSQAAAWQHATALREAALLLEPQDAEQRLQLIADYRLWQYAAPPSYFQPQTTQHLGTEDFAKQFQDACQQQITRFHFLTVHIEPLIRQQALNPREAAMLITFVAQDASQFLLPYVNDSSEIRESLYRFYRAVVPKIVKLGRSLRDGAVHPAIGRAASKVTRFDAEAFGTMSARQQFDLCTSSATYFLTNLGPPWKTWDPERRKLVVQPMSSEDRWTLDELTWFLTEINPDEYLLDSVIGLVIQKESTGYGSFLADVPRGRFTVESLRAFYERLRNSRQPANEFYARCGMLALRTYALDGELLDADAVREADALRKQYVQRNRSPVLTSSSAVMARQLDLLYHDVALRAGQPTSKKHKLTPNPIPEFNAQQRVSFHPIDGLVPRWTDVRRCGESLDVMWSHYAVFVMQQPGVVRQIFASDRPFDSIVSVQYDGANVWIGLRYSGIRIVSLEGRIVGEMRPDNGLPRYDEKVVNGVFGNRYVHPLILHPIESGRCLAMGRFGDQGRLWIALVSLHAKDGNARDGGATVQMIYRATLAQDAEDSIEAIFDPAWLTEYADASAPGQRELLIGRRELTGAKKAGRRPLAIDLATFGVSLFPGSLPASPISDSLSEVTCSRSRFLWAGFRSIDAFTRADDERDEAWTRTSLVTRDPHSRPLPNKLLRHDGAFYSAGYLWYRIDEPKFKVEQLTTTRLPYQHHYQCYGVSAHYGLVGWNVGDHVYQAQIHELAECTDLSILYPHVPEPLRDKHAKAVESIRRLGGHVDAIWGTDVREIPSLPIRFVDHIGPKQWFTFVYLSDRWRGGDEGLAPLADLYDLRALYLVKAGVTDRGVQALPVLDALRVLHLVETKVSDSGLSCLSRLPNLEILRLEGSVGGRELGDAGLPNLALVPKLVTLELYGSAFTDAGLQPIREAPSLRQVMIVDTAITPRAMDAMKTSKPGFRWSAPVLP